MRPWILVALISICLAPLAEAQFLTNDPVYLGEEGPRTFRREMAIEHSGPMTLRWVSPPDHAINPDTGNPGALSHIVVARWNPKACARKRGPLCRERGAWEPAYALRSEDLDEGTDTLTVTAGGSYLLFGRSRFRPSRRDSWKSDLLIDVVEKADPAGARELLFDTSTSVEGGVRYTVTLTPTR